MKDKENNIKTYITEFLLVIGIIFGFILLIYAFGLFQIKDTTDKTANETISYEYEITVINPNNNKIDQRYYTNRIIHDREDHSITFTDEETGENITLTKYVINAIKSNNTDEIENKQGAA